MRLLTALLLAIAALWAVTTSLPADAGERDEAVMEAPRSVSVPEGGATIALESAEAHPIVDVTIHGRKLRFLVETGAWFNSISAETAESLDLPVWRGEAEIDRIDMGSASLTGLKARVLEDQPGEVDGQLGLPAFADLLLTLDFPRREMRLSRGDLAETNGRDVLPLEAIGPMWGVPVRVGGKAFTALLDTQSGDGLAIAPPLARQVAFSGPMIPTGHVHGPAIGDAAVRTARLDGDVELGAFRFTRPIVSSFPVELRFEKLGVWLGPQLLQSFSVTLDQRNRRVRFVRSSQEPVIAPPPPLGDFGFRVEKAGDGRVRVNAVKRGGEAERAGVRAGDELVSFDRKPASAFSDDAWRELYGHSQPVRFSLMHDGEQPRDLDLRPTILVP